MKLRRKAIFLKITAILAVLMLLASCTAIANSAGATQTPALPTATSIIQPSATARPSATPRPSHTASPTASPTASATLTTTSTPSTIPQTSDSLDLQGVPANIQALVTGSTPTPLPLPTHVSQAPSPAPTETPGQATVTPSPTPSEQTLYDQYLPGAKVIGETEHFVFYADKNGYFPLKMDQWKVQAEEVYAYVSERIGAKGTKKIPVAFLPTQKQTCPIRGLTSDAVPPQIIIFADSSSSQAFILGVLAHEVGHAISAEGYPGGMPNDLALTEGLATYGSGKYWAAYLKVPSIDILIRQYIEQGKYMPLEKILDLPNVYPWQQGSGQNCLALRDQEYGEWASFIGFLVERYGWDKAHQLFESAHSETKDGLNIDYPTDYPGVYGKTLNQLEVDWLKYVLSQREE